MVAAALAIDGGDLPLGGGLLALIRPALDHLEPGGVLAVLSTSKSAREDLSSWCRVERHVYLGFEDGRHLIERGTLGAPRPFPEGADPGTGLALAGSRVEPGGPRYPFSLLDRDRVMPPEVGKLYQQAAASQWSARDDIPWREAKKLPAALDRAIAQIMTFLAENELAALYVPSRFVARIHPAYVETAMFLATQMADESRHVDVFVERARIAGGLGISSVPTSVSLRSLFDPEDFTESSFLLSVLGEGTFLDLLRFIETHAPDAATAEIAKRTRADESRHVHFGIAHVRHALACDPTLFSRLEATVRRRAATLHEVTSVPARVQDALTVIAAGGDDPGSIARGHEQFRELLQVMHQSRAKRLQTAGFTPEQAEVLSQLHSANFM
ncbi:MAG: ferritin-like domain-containing protein [Polyangiales bacterium]